MMTEDREDEIKTRRATGCCAYRSSRPHRTNERNLRRGVRRIRGTPAAYRRFESIWQEAATLEELQPLAALPRHAILVATRRARASRFTRCAGREVRASRWRSLRRVSGIARARVLRDRIAEVREIHLSDGSDVTLGARSSLEVAFRIHERRIALTSGVAFFSVSKIPRSVHRARRR